MATGRMLNRGGLCSSSTFRSGGFSELRSSVLKISCVSNNNNGVGENNWLPCSANKVEKKKKTVAPVVEVKASTSGCLVITSTPKTDKVADFARLLGDAADLFFAFIRRSSSLVMKSIQRRWHFQMFVEKVIVDCRFFTMLGVGGTLLGSLLCFFEGCVLIVESYVKYFHSISQGSAQEHLVHLLIEAIDMFLVATAMLVFATGLHVMFIGSSSGFKGKGSQILVQPNFIKTLPSRVGIHTVMQAKSKIGQAVIMILQVGMLEKFKTIPLLTSLDFTCFAAAVFASSACTFLLSKLAIRG